MEKLRIRLSSAQFQLKLPVGAELGNNDQGDETDNSKHNEHDNNDVMGEQAKIVLKILRSVVLLRQILSLSLALEFRPGIRSTISSFCSFRELLLICS